MPSKIDSVRQLDSEMMTRHTAIARHIATHPELTYSQIAELFRISRHTVARVARAAHMKRARGVKLKPKVPS